MGVLGRWLIVTGAILILVGVVFVAAGSVPGLGRLPGDIEIRRGNFHFYAPLGTCLLISVLASLLLSLLWRR